MDERQTFEVNGQLRNAINWLKGMGFIKNAADLAKQLPVSGAQLSDYMNNKAHVTGNFIVKFERKFLKPRNFTLEDFKHALLPKQAGQTEEDFREETRSHMLKIEAMQLLLLELVAEGMGEKKKAEAFERIMKLKQ